MVRIGFSIRDLLLATALVAVSFVLLGIVPGGLLATAVLVFVAVPTGSRWSSVELAATAAWFLGGALAFSNVRLPEFAVRSFTIFGLVLGLSWVVRHLTRRDKARSHLETFFLPASAALAICLLISDFDFSMRLHISERALQADAASGQFNASTPDLVGLFLVERFGRQGNCTLWTTSRSTIDVDHEAGLAYCPGIAPTNFRGVRFKHLRGPWWSFTNRIVAN